MKNLILAALFLFLSCTTSADQPHSESLSDISLANANSEINTRLLMQYLQEQYGNSIIAGQQDLTWNDSVNMIERVYKKTGKYPAVMGYDFMNYHRDDIDGGSGLQQVEEAIEWWNRGGIVTFCWHWRDPSLETIAFYTKDTEFRIDLSDSLVHSQLLRDIDLIAGDLKRLQDAGVPVLWRPLHEASGAWFWWGASGAQPYIDLWRLMYDRMTEFHELNNLIWVYNGQDPNWYPGDSYVDIIGEDVYADAINDSIPNYSSQLDRFVEARDTSPTGKMVALTENSYIPHPDSIFADGATWSWFCVWNDGVDPENPRNFFSGTFFNTDEHKKLVYNHPKVLTLVDVAERPR